MNKDCIIDEDEFVYVFKVFGYENEVLVRKVFFFYNKENKYVFLKDIVSEWVKFVMEEDFSKKDIIMEVFKEGF